MSAIRKLPALLAGLALLTACAASPQAEQPVRRTRAVSALTSTEHEVETPRYTRADYRFLESLYTADYQSQPLEAFNAALLDWSDEDAFHKNEAALQRLQAALPKDDPLRPFLDGTVSASWSECRRRHYNACAQGRSPAADGTISWEEKADVFGDQVTTAWSWGDFWYTYTPGPSVTVGERDGFLQGVSGGMQAYLDGCGADLRPRQKDMERALLAELKRLTAELGGERFPVKDWEVSYQWEQVYD